MYPAAILEPRDIAPNKQKINTFLKAINLI
jgi:hypothetical protein